MNDIKLINMKCTNCTKEHENNNTGCYNSGDYNSGDYNSGNSNSGYRNSGHYNSGDGNSGNSNSGDYNSGYRNSGYRNSGDYNSGDYNSGHYNSGYYNSGYRNSGHGNSGYRNSGDGNSGNSNSGHYNSGHGNSGYRNSGDGNSGYRNSGYYNSGDGNSGWFNTNEPKMRFFNKDSDVTYSEFSKGKMVYPDLKICSWVDIKDLPESGKDENAIQRGGTLKTLTYKEAWAEYWGRASEEDKQWFQDLPNFDAQIFEEITGINVGKKSLSGKTVKVEIDGISYEAIIK